jgi:TPR repeat protein
VPQDGARAVALLSNACPGFPEACAALVEMFERGIAVRVDPVAAQRWRAQAPGAAPIASPTSTDPHRACLLGSPEACLTHAARKKAAGPYTPTDRGEVVEHLALACRMGAVEGCLELATDLATNSLGRPDPPRAAALLEDACRMLSPAACVELLRAGRPLPIDPPVAEPLLERWCREGVGEACVRAPAR